MLKLVANNPGHVPRQIVRAEMREVTTRFALHADSLMELGALLQRTADALPVGERRRFLGALKFLKQGLSLDENSVNTAILVLRCLLENYENARTSTTRH